MIYVKRAILIFLLFLLFLPFTGCNKKDEGLLFELMDDGQSYRLIGYNEISGSTYDIKIPKKYKGLPVTTIGEKALIGNYAISVYIPETITCFEGIQYTGYNVSSIVVDEKNKLFDSRNKCNAVIESSTNKLIIGCGDTVIPNTVKEIGEYAFYMTFFDPTIVIPDSVVKIGDYAFSLTYIDAIDIPESVKELGKRVFMESTLKAVRLPKSLEVIDDQCFAYTGLVSLTIYGNANKIGNGITMSCPLLHSLEVIDNPIYDSRENCNAIIETKTNTLIAGIVTTVIPKSVLAIARFALFGNCIETMFIPNNIQYIGDFAFYSSYSFWNLEFESTEWKAYLPDDPDNIVDVQFDYNHNRTYYLYHKYVWIKKGEVGA